MEERIYHSMKDKYFLYILFLIFTLLIFASGPLEAREIIASGEYIMGDGETMSVSEERARMNAARKAAEEAGTLVRSYSKVRNMALEEDVIEVIADHAMKITVLSKKREMVSDAVRFVVQIKAEISDADIEANLKRIIAERQAVTDYQKLKAEFDSQNRLLADLKKQLSDVSVDKKKMVLGKIGENENRFRAAVFLEEGLRRISQLDNPGAVDVLTKAIELNPDLALAYAARAEAGLWDTKHEVVLQDANQAIALEPQNARFYAVRARVLAFRGCSVEKPDGCKDVIADLEKAKSMDPKNPAYFDMAGKLYTSLNRYESAAKEYDRSVELASSVALPLNAANAYLERAEFILNAAGENFLNAALRDLDKAVAIITGPIYMTEDTKKFIRIFAAKPKNDKEGIRLVREIFGLDAAKMSENERNAFIERSKEAEIVLKNAGLVYWRRAQVLYESGDVKGAEKDRIKACELNGGGDNITYVGGIIADIGFCTPKGIFRPFPSKEALSAYQFFKQGERLFARSRFTEAVVQYSHALELDRKLADAWLKRGLTYMYSAKPDFEQAIADFSEVLRTDPQNARVLYERGLASWAWANEKSWNGDKKGAKQDRIFAEKDFTAVLTLPDNIYKSSALVQRAKIYEMQDRWELAAADYDAAARGNDIQFFLREARALQMAGKNKKAVKVLDEFLSIAGKALAEKGEFGDELLSQQIADAHALKKELSASKPEKAGQSSMK